MKALIEEDIGQKTFKYGLVLVFLHGCRHWNAIQILQEGENLSWFDSPLCVDCMMSRD